MAIAVIVDWMGPFATVPDAQKVIRDLGFGEGLYLAIGSAKRKSGLQYVGIASDLNNRVKPDHEKLSNIRQLSLWVGEVASHAVAGRGPGRRRLRFSRTVSLAEWATAYFLKLPLNDQLRRKPPPDALVLVNRWFQHDFDTRRLQRPDPKWPDFIDYDGRGEGATIVWFGTRGRRTRLSPSDVADLARGPRK